jgi:hypothetical protein
MRVSKPPLRRMSALLPLTGATTFHVPAWLASATKSFCWTLGLIAGFTREGVGLVPSHRTPPSGGLRAAPVKIVLLAGMAMTLRSVPALGRAVRRDSLASERKCKGDSLELRWNAGLKANVPENSNVRNCFTLNPLSSGLIANLMGSIFHAHLRMAFGKQIKLNHNVFI